MKKLILCTTVLSALFASALQIEKVKCEYAVDPVGIDTLEPRLSWVLSSEERGEDQSAYQVQVAVSPEALKNGKFLWDSGKVISDQSLNVVYKGSALKSGMRCYWQVRVWDRKDRVTSWSKPALWQVALLEPTDWKTSWIGLSSQGNPEWEDVTISVDLTLQERAAGIVFRAMNSDNFYMWQFNNGLGPDLLLRPHICKSGKWYVLRAVNLRKFIPAADDHKTHRIEIQTRGDLIKTLIDGKLVDERRDSTFKCGTVGFRADSSERFTVDNLIVKGTDGKELLKENFDGEKSVFNKAKIEKGCMAVGDAIHLYLSEPPKDCPRFRKTFSLDKPVKRATASVCGLGFYEFYLNGSKADDRVLAPANSSYNQRIFFDTIDVTTYLRKGKNTAGFWLAPGYASDYSKWGWKWLQPKRAILQLDIIFEDGSSTTIGTDGSWTTAPSPIKAASLYHGELYDARLETPGWSKPDFNADGWKPVMELAPPRGRLLPNIMPPLKVCATLKPKKVTEPKPGVFVFDMGQNFAGWVRLRVKGRAGTQVTMRHAEMIGEDGMLDLFTNRRAKSTDRYILKGKGTEIYEPRFTYHGFRYVEVTGYPGKPTLEDITGCVVHSDVANNGHFVCSDETINRIQSNCLWSMRSNFYSIPTDCCNRDERTPCQMDSQAYEDSAFCSFSMNRYYSKWLQDIAGGRGNPDWNGDQVSVPWLLYKHTGDRRVLENSYENIKGYVEYLNKKVPGHVYTDGFGDWCPPNDGSWDGYHGDVTELNTTIYAGIVRVAEETARLLGKDEDAKHFSKLRSEIADAFYKKRFDKEKKIYGDGSQTTAVMPLAFNLVPEKERQPVFDQLVKTIKEKNKGHIDTGIFGTRYLVDVLCDFGAEDLAVSILKKPGYPGFVYQIEKGATTLWEQWSFKGGMNSHNHVMFAGVSSSFYTRFAGIDYAAPGYKKISIKPSFPSALNFAEAKIGTPYGPVFSRWERRGERILMKVKVPVNTTAVLALPCAFTALNEGGREATASSDISALAFDSKSCRCRLVSGSYEFEF